MKLLGITESKITKDKNGENVLHLEAVELVLVHCNLVNNDYQQDSRILYTFVRNKTLSSLLQISPTNHVFLKTFISEFQEVKIWFTDQTSKPLELEDKIKYNFNNITFIKMRYSMEPRERRYEKGYGFMSFASLLHFSDKYSKFLMDKGIDVSKTFAKTVGKKILKETAKATGDLIGNKIANKITAKPSKKSHDEVNNEIPKERYISPKERQKIIDELKLA